MTQPITILLSLPLSFGGVVLGLLATNNAVTMPVYIGIIMLVGIVTKNAIMLVDFGVEKMKEGVKPVEAIIDAGRKRARPIVMTTLAMVAGMLPSAYALGDGGEFRSPMAIAVIGGLLVSTVLSPRFRAVILHHDGLCRALPDLGVRPLHRPDRRARRRDEHRRAAEVKPHAAESQDAPDIPMAAE